MKNLTRKFVALLFLLISLSSTAGLAATIRGASLAREGLALSAPTGPVTISSQTVDDYRYGGMVAYLHFYSSDDWFDDQGTPHKAAPKGSGQWFKEVACTVSGTTAAIPSFPLMPTTSSTTNPNVTYTAVWADENEIERDDYMSDFQVPANLGATLTWQQIALHNRAHIPYQDNRVYTRKETEDQIASSSMTNVLPATDSSPGKVKLKTAATSSSDPIVPGDNDPRLNGEYFVQSFSTFTSALTVCASTDSNLVIDTIVTKADTATIPATCHFRYTKTGQILSSFNYNFLASIEGNPSTRIFSGSGVVSFAGNSYAKGFNSAWWGAIGNNSTDCGAAVNATATAVKSLGSGTIQIPSGPCVMLSTLDLSSAHRIAIKGAGPRSFSKSELKFNVSGSGILVNISNSDALTFQDIAITNNHAGFTGDILGNNPGTSTNGIGIYDSYIAGTASSASAQSCINLSNANSWVIDHCEFYYAHFCLANFGGSYSNAITIRGRCQFALYGYYAIANPFKEWSIEDGVIEPAANGQVNGIACAINASGVLDGPGAGAIATSVKIQRTGFWDDTLAGGINVAWAGSGLVLDGNYSETGGVANTFLNLRLPGNGFHVSGNYYSSGNGSKFIDNSAVKLRGFWLDDTNRLVPISGTITKITFPGYLMPSRGCVMDLTTAQIATLASLYVGEESDHAGVLVIDTSLTPKTLKVYDGSAFQTIKVNPIQQVLYGTSNGTTVAAATTTYMGIGSLTPNTTEGARQVKLPFACTLKNLTVLGVGAQDASGSLVFTVRKNGVDTALTVTVAAGASSANVTDSTHTVTFAANDLLSIKVVNNMTTGTSTFVSGISLEQTTP